MCVVRALAWQGEVLTSRTSAQTPRAFWPLLLGQLPQPPPTAQAFPLLGSGQQRARAPPELPRLVSQGSSGSCIPFLFSLTCLGARAFPQLDSHPSKGSGPVLGPQAPAQMGEAGSSQTEHLLHSLVPTMTRGRPAARGGSSDQGAEGSEQPFWRRWPLS